MDVEDESKERLWHISHYNDSFINRTRLPLLCEKSGAILLVPVDLMAGWQSDKILIGLKILKSPLLGFPQSQTKESIMIFITSVFWLVRCTCVVLV